MRGFLPWTGVRAVEGLVVVIVLLAACSRESARRDLAEVRAASSESDRTSQAEDPGRDGWRLVWRDEFDGESLDDSKWSRVLDCWGGGNDELQCYTDRSDNAYVADGLLHMIAKEERFSGPKYAESDRRYDRNDKSKTSPFTSARIHTRDKMAIRYGRIDIRAKIPAGRGMWPALWMLPQDNTYGIWPSSGEIDIMEALNPGIAENEVHGTLHYGLQWPQWENKVGAFPMESSPAEDFHVYSVEWEADQIRWYVDGRHYQTQSSAGWYNYIWMGQDLGFRVANPRAPFDRAFYLIMNIAIGGNWPGDPDRNWPADRKMLVDYVRVYRCGEGDTAGADYTGEGCATVDPAVTLNADAGAPGTHQFTLYADGPATLEFDVEGGRVTNSLLPGERGSGGGNVHQEQVVLGGDRGTVWDIEFEGHGGVFLASRGTATVPGYERGLVLGGGAGWTIHGEVEFDLLVKDASRDSRLAVRLESGDGEGGSAPVEMPESGQWRHVAIRLADILSNPPPEDGGVDLANVINAFVLEHTGSAAHVQVDNVRLRCAYNTEPEPWQTDQTCGLSPREIPPEPVFARINEVDWTAWDCCGGAEFTEVDDAQAGAKVVEFSFDSTATAPGFKAPRALDMTAYAGGSLEFDFKLVSPPPAGSVWHVKLEAAATAAQVLLTDGGPPPGEAWQHYLFPLKGPMDSADLSNIKYVLVFPDWGKAEGAVMRIDNVEFTMP